LRSAGLKCTELSNSKKFKKMEETNKTNSDPALSKTAVMPSFHDIDYNVGDILVSKENPNKEIGICTGFSHNDTCVNINDKCWGGRTHFMKSEWVDCLVLNEA
jgi:hypothetical protein